jgi:hypothetical protein
MFRQLRIAALVAASVMLPATLDLGAGVRWSSAQAQGWCMSFGTVKFSEPNCVRALCVRRGPCRQWVAGNPRGFMNPNGCQRMICTSVRRGR